MLEQLKENPVITLVTSITALLAGLNNIVGSFGLPPFWSDVLVSLFIGYSLGLWLRYVWTNTETKRQGAGLVSTSKNPLRSPAVRGFRQLGPATFMPLLLGGLLIWNAWPPVTHIFQRNWRLCGTFITHCKQRPCIELFDSRNRRIADECMPLEDDSGYKYLEAPNRWTYKPKFVVVHCGEAVTQRIVLDASMFQNLCNGKLQLQ